LPPWIDFPGFLRKWKAAEENWKAVEVIRKPLKKIFSDFSEMRKPLKKIKL
jgi:hypothetical protein